MFVPPLRVFYRIWVQQNKMRNVYISVLIYDFMKKLKHQTYTRNLVLSTESLTQIGHRKEFESWHKMSLKHSDLLAWVLVFYSCETAWEHVTNSLQRCHLSRRLICGKTPQPDSSLTSRLHSISKSRAQGHFGSLSAVWSLFVVGRSCMGNYYGLYSMYVKYRT